jgi:hypothetical protein
MEKINRLGWADGLCFNSYGVRIGVRVNRPEILDRLQAHFPPGWKPSQSPVVDRLYSFIIGGVGSKPNIRRFNILYGNVERLIRTVELDPLFDIFESDVQMHVAEEAPRRLFVHAGVVGWQGRAILIPGRSLSGKSTLVAELVRAGATYYSDEYAVLDDRGRVHPYTRHLGIRENGRMKKYPVESLGGSPGIKPLPVGLVVVSNYKSGARWRPRYLSPGQGALALLDNTVSARRQPQVALATLRRVVANAPVLKGVRGEANQVIDYIFGILNN